MQYTVFLSMFSLPLLAALLLVASNPSSRERASDERTRLAVTFEPEQRVGGVLQRESNKVLQTRGGLGVRKVDSGPRLVMDVCD